MPWNTRSVGHLQPVTKCSEIDAFSCTVGIWSQRDAHVTKVVNRLQNFFKQNWQMQKLFYLLVWENRAINEPGGTLWIEISVFLKIDEKEGTKGFNRALRSFLPIKTSLDSHKFSVTLFTKVPFMITCSCFNKYDGPVRQLCGSLVKWVDVSMVLSCLAS